MNLPLSLFRLQNLDTQLRHIYTRLKEIETILLQDESVQKALKFLEGSKEVVKDQAKNLKDIEEQVQAKMIKFKLTQASLFSGKISNTKELQDLQNEGEALKRTITKLEEEQLMFMIALEEAQEAQRQTEYQYKQAIADQVSKNSRLLGEKTKLENDLPGLETQRQSIAQGIPSLTLEIYENLIKTKAGKAVAEVMDDSCNACGAMLTPAEIQSARSPATLLRCRTCGRILYKS